MHKLVVMSHYNIAFMKIHMLDTPELAFDDKIWVFYVT